MRACQGAGASEIARFFEAQPELKASMFDLVIRNGTLIDGTNAPRRTA